MEYKLTSSSDMLFANVLNNILSCYGNLAIDSLSQLFKTALTPLV